MIDEEHRVQRLPASAREFEIAREELERLLRHSYFKGSKRYPAMLRYVVEQTLAGQQSDIKERTIGIEVFGRSPAYDTNSDPVVRFSAGEIRKRLARIYSEDAQPQKLRLELPIGAYLPNFLWESTESISDAASKNFLPAVVECEQAEHGENQMAQTGWSRSRLLAVISAGALTLILLLVFWLKPLAHHQVTSVWRPLLDRDDKIVMSVGQPSLGSHNTVTEKSVSIDEHLVESDFRVSIPTAHVIADLAAFLRAQRKGFELHGAGQSTLANLYRKPVVLVGAMDNQWTLSLLKPMRFRFGSNGSKGVIEDSSRPDFRDWTLDFSQPYMKQTVDYAIFARFISPMTNAPVIVIAGLGSNGNEAAADFSLDEDAIRELLKQAPKNWSGSNFEAVLKVDIVGGDTGGATVVATQFW